MALSSNSWVIIWIFIEINSICICTLLSKESKIFNKENEITIIYIVIQLTSSILLLININRALNNLITQLICIFCLVIKIGAWPFHLWYIKTITPQNMKTIRIKTLMTWQKLLPLILLSYISFNSLIIFFIAITSIIIPIFKIKKLSSIKSILILSSVNNNGWFLISIILSLPLLITYFLIYRISLLVTIDFLKTLKSKKNLINSKFWYSLLIISNIGSIPPTIIFFSKTFIIWALCFSFCPKEILFFIICIACFFIYNYLWGSFLTLINLPQKTQILKTKDKYFHLLIIITSSIFPILLFFLG